MGMDNIPRIKFPVLVSKLRRYGYTAKRIEEETGIKSHTVYNYGRKSQSTPSYDSGAALWNLAIDCGMSQSDLYDCIDRAIAR